MIRSPRSSSALHVRVRVAARLDLVEHPEHPRRRAAVQRAGERADRRGERGGAVGAGRGGDPGGEGRGVQAVLGGRDPVGVERLHVPAGRPRRASGSGTGRRRSRRAATSDSGTGGGRAAGRLRDDRERRGREPGEIVPRLPPARCRRAGAAPTSGPSVASPACRSAITEPLASWSSIGSAVRHPRLEAARRRAGPRPARTG